jgi:hypothetical protein
MLPSTVDRVPRHTSAKANARIRREMRRRIARLRRSGPGARKRRLRELDREWDIERVLEANASSLALLGLGMGVFVHRAFLALPAAVMAFFLQHALQGWCPPIPLFRRLGIRTSYEIDEERYALMGVPGRDLRPRPRKT